MSNNDRPTDHQLDELRMLATRSALASGASSLEAEEVAQRTVIKLAERWANEDILAVRSRGQDDWRSYVAKMARNLHVDSVRSHERRIARERRALGVVGEPLIDRPGVRRAQPQEAAGVEQYLARLVLEDAIDRLDSRHQRECVRKFYLEGLSVRQTAEALDVREPTVRFHLRNAMKRLRLELSASDYSSGP